MPSICRVAGLFDHGQEAEHKQGRRPHLWDGNAAERIVEVLANGMSRL